MTKYKTYMSVTFHSGSAQPSEITNVLREYGWKPVYGSYDYVYEWEKDFTETEEAQEEYWEHITNVHHRLKPLNVWYNLRTYEYGKEDFTTIYCRC